MIKFFRHIRRSLIQENKMGKYFKYAIGEIVLVVIGILIALQINNWNENRKDRAEELKILKSLHKEVKSNIAAFDFDYTIQQRNMKAIQNVVILRPSLYTLGQLDSIFSSTRPHSYNASFGILNSIVSTGKIELITNDSLKESISELKDYIIDYREDEDKTLDMGTYITKLWVEDEFYIDNEILMGVRPRTALEEQQDKQKYIALYNSPKIKKAFLSMLTLNAGVIEEGGRLKHRFTRLLETIESEIQRLGND
ncbi:MAG: hypothetical protein ED556_02020 [Winogradskyella sp.]|uniref:DUF6090 family protein n=1 Tax=Winogradskyella sp. TaxID=1883156 RepID=UPI000F3D0142|nr:DUF6090 family protein [Winogradskyella sp.]RNC87989.1 MAG: hypothetical protein ED556_02020 [Winogradskyella sp.]